MEGEIEGKRLGQAFSEPHSYELASAFLWNIFIYLFVYIRVYIYIFVFIVCHFGPE